MMIVDPYRFAVSGPEGDVTIVVQDFATGGATGSFDYTTTALTGITPKAALIFGSEALVSSGSAETAVAQIAVAGVDTSPAEFGLNTGSRNGTASSDVGRVLVGDSTANPFAIDDIAVAGNQVAANPTLISGGINLNYVTNDLSFQSHYMAFAGPDLQADVGYVFFPSDTTPVDVTTVGFQPDIVLFFGTMSNSGSAQGTFASFVFGAAHNDGTQRCFMMNEQDAQADATPYMGILTNRAYGKLDGTGALVYDVTIGSFDASGFTATQSANPAGDDIAFLAFASPRRYKIFDITTPTSTGNQSITGIGFEPQAVLLLLSTLTATDPSFPLTSGATMSAFSLSTIADETWSTAYRTQAGAATMNTASNCQNEILHPSGTSTNAGRATLVSFDSDGFTLNWSAVQGSATKGFGIAFE